MSPYRTEIAAAAAAHGLEPLLVAAVVEQESATRFHAYRYEPDFFVRYLASNPAYMHREPREVSASYGLMQIMYPTAVDHGFTGEPWDLFAPEASLHWGCRYLAHLLDWAGTTYRGLQTAKRAAVLRTALAAYNGGQGGAHAPAAVAYAAQVLLRLDRLRTTESA
jgi:soluble lytic murein transglycosylase-like protein